MSLQVVDDDSRSERKRQLRAARNRRLRRRKRIQKRLARRLGLVSTDRALIAAIVARRRALGLSQLALNQATGLADGYIGKLECGLKNPGLMSLSLILEALGLGMVLVPGEPPRVVSRSVKRPQRKRRKSAAPG